MKYNPAFLQVQQFKENVMKVFTTCEDALERHFTLKNVTEVSMSHIDPENPPKVTHSYLEEYSKFTVALTDPSRPEGYHFGEMSTTEDAPYHIFITTPKKVVDVQFYLPEVLSLLFDMGPEPMAGFAQVRDQKQKIPSNLRAKFAGSVSTNGRTLLNTSNRGNDSFQICCMRYEESCSCFIGIEKEG